MFYSSLKQNHRFFYSNRSNNRCGKVYGFLFGCQQREKGGNSLWKSAGKEVDRNVDKNVKVWISGKLAFLYPEPCFIPDTASAVVDLLTALWLWSQPRA